MKKKKKTARVQDHPPSSLHPPPARQLEQWLQQVARDARQRGLKWTRQREIVTRCFLETWIHTTVEELHRPIQQHDPGIGITTIYRPVHMLRDMGYARELNFEDGRIRFEPRGTIKPHHDHLVCIKCGRYIEFFDERLEERQMAAAQAHHFAMINHRLDIFGYCEQCDPARSGTS